MFLPCINKSDDDDDPFYGPLIVRINGVELYFEGSRSFP